MGTRNLVVVKLDGEYKVAQYGQWDGYPCGQGKTLLDFLSTWNRQQFEEKLRASKFMQDDDFVELKTEIEKNGLGDSWAEHFPWLCRNTGAGVLKLIHDQPSGIKLRNSLDFAADSLFCEWGYVIDLDTNTLEVYRGFNHKPLEPHDRFFGVTCSDAADGYFPIKKAAEYRLDNLPTVEQMEIDTKANSDE